MAFDTVAFSKKGNGWSTRYSFQPDWMINMNNSFYTFKEGDLYLHHDNALRNTFYGTTYNSEVTTIFNQDPIDQKVFKTLSLESNRPWKAEVTTDRSTGLIESSYFVEKEGSYYGHIRRNDGTVDLKAISTQGIGEVSTYAAGVVTIIGEVPSISVGDTLYISNGSTLDEVEVITDYTSNTITVTTPPTNTPAPGDFIVAVKNSTAESHGLRGYYMEAKLTYVNSSSRDVELFSVSSEAFASKP